MLDDILKQLIQVCCLWNGDFGYINVTAYYICSQWNLIYSCLIHLVLMFVLLREITYRQLSILYGLLSGQEGAVDLGKNIRNQHSKEKKAKVILAELKAKRDTFKLPTTST